FGIKVRVLGVHHHQWKPGNQFYHDPFEYREEHFSYQLWLVKSGCVHVDMNGTVWDVTAGSVCLFPVNLERIVSTAEPAAWLSIGLRITVFNKFTLFQNVPLPVRWQP